MSLPYSSHFWNLLDCGSPTRDEKRYDWMLLASQTASPLAMLPAERLVGGAAAAVASGHQGRRACAKVTHKNTDCRCRSSQRQIRWPCAFARSFAFGCWATRTRTATPYEHVVDQTLLANQPTTPRTRANLRARPIRWPPAV